MEKLVCLIEKNCSKMMAVAFSTSATKKNKFHCFSFGEVGQFAKNCAKENQLVDTLIS